MFKGSITDLAVVAGEELVLYLDSQADIFLQVRVSTDKPAVFSLFDGPTGPTGVGPAIQENEDRSIAKTRTPPAVVQQVRSVATQGVKFFEQAIPAGTAEYVSKNMWRLVSGDQYAAVIRNDDTAATARMTITLEFYETGQIPPVSFDGPPERRGDRE